MLAAPSEISYIVTMLKHQRRMSRAYHDRVIAPAREALEYEKQVFRSPVDGNPFAGPPRPELDAAWHNLLKSSHTIGNERLRMIFLLLTPFETDIHIRVSKDEMEKYGGRSLELTDGSGYAASLEVYHDLHCLVVSLVTSHLGHY